MVLVRQGMDATFYGQTSAVDCHRLRGLASTSRADRSAGQRVLHSQNRRRRMLLIGLIASVGLITTCRRSWFIRSRASAHFTRTRSGNMSQARNQTGMRRSGLTELWNDLAIEFPQSWVAVRLREPCEYRDRRSCHRMRAPQTRCSGRQVGPDSQVYTAAVPLVEEGLRSRQGSAGEAVRGVGGSGGARVGPARTEELISARAIVEARVWYRNLPRSACRIRRSSGQGGRRPFVLALPWRIPIGRLGRFDRFECEERQVVPLWPGSRIGSMTVKTPWGCRLSKRTAEQARSRH